MLARIGHQPLVSSSGINSVRRAALSPRFAPDICTRRRRRPTARMPLGDAPPSGAHVARRQRHERTHAQPQSAHLSPPDPVEEENPLSRNRSSWRTLVRPLNILLLLLPRIYPVAEAVVTPVAKPVTSPADAGFDWRLARWRCARSAWSSVMLTGTCPRLVGFLPAHWPGCQENPPS
jgi:hypothetical protein